MPSDARPMQPHAQRRAGDFQLLGEGCLGEARARLQGARQDVLAQADRGLGLGRKAGDGT